MGENNLIDIDWQYWIGNSIFPIPDHIVQDLVLSINIDQRPRISEIIDIFQNSEFQNSMKDDNNSSLLEELEYFKKITQFQNDQIQLLQANNRKSLQNVDSKCFPSHCYFLKPSSSVFDMNVDEQSFSLSSLSFSTNSMSKPKSLLSQQGFHIGIDLGTSNCCMAVYRSTKDPQGRIKPEMMEIILNRGKNTTPSVIACRKGHIEVGHAAQKRSLKSPESTIFEAKRFIGRKFSDPEIQKNLRHNQGKPSHWPFKVESDGTSDDNPLLILSDGGTERKFSPEQVSAFVLTHLKEVAEESLGGQIDALTVTCPAYFNDEQRQATKDAAEMAGFDTVRILNEPTAAALAFKQEDNRAIGKTALVFDFGGGTLDVSIVKITEQDVTVLATGGDTSLRDVEIDTIMVDYCIKEFREETGCSEEISAQNMAKLKKAVAEAKETLSSAEEEDVLVTNFVGGDDLDVTITREDLERECHDFFLRCIGVVDAILDQSSISRDQIDLVLMVEGSRDIPKLVELMADRFPNKLRSTVLADHAIAMGAAVAHLHMKFS
ncbi:hypothetical protein GEMRC1_011203 [Eukaryota sp. GEM-RC1]